MYTDKEYATIKEGLRKLYQFHEDCLRRSNGGVTAKRSGHAMAADIKTATNNYSKLKDKEFLISVMEHISYMITL